MGQLAGSTFGIGTPTTYPVPTAWGFSPYAGQGPAIQPFALQPYLQSLSSPLTSGYGVGAVQPVQHVQQLLQILPQQLQQVQFLQQLQLVHLQQLLQLLPAQLQQIQQLVQVLPQQLQHFQQPWQPLAPAISSPMSFGMVPQAFSGQPPSHVM